MFNDLDAKYFWNCKGINISERGIELRLITDFFKDIEPVVGDITKTGFSVFNSDTGDMPLKASFFLYRIFLSVLCNE